MYSEIIASDLAQISDFENQRFNYPEEELSKSKYEDHLEINAYETTQERDINDTDTYEI